MNLNTSFLFPNSVLDAMRSGTVISSSLITYAAYNQTPRWCYPTSMLLRSGSSVNSRSGTPASSVNSRSGTLALRIQFNGWDGQNVSRTSQDHIQSLIPWLRAVLTRLHLPHPRPTNVIKSKDATRVVEMYWDHPLAVVLNASTLCLPSTFSFLTEGEYCPVHVERRG